MQAHTRLSIQVLQESIMGADLAGVTESCCLTQDTTLKGCSFRAVI